LFYNKFIMRLYMFRALCAHHQEVKIVLYSIWCHHTCRCTGCERGPLIRAQINPLPDDGVTIIPKYVEAVLM